MQPLFKNILAYLGLAILFVGIVGVAGYLGTRSSDYNSVGTTTSDSEDKALSPVPDVIEGNFPLEVTAPTDQFVSSSRSIVVRGKTAPNADVAINDVDLVADTSGNFQATLLLDEGENQIVITANNDQGAQHEKTLTVIVSL